MKKAKECGDPINLKIEMALNEIKQRLDKRFFYLNVIPEIKDKKISFSGYVHFPQMKAAVLNYMKEHVKGYSIDIKKIKALSEMPLTFVQVNQKCVMLYREPSDKAPEETQEMYGRYVRSFMEKDGWIFVQAIDGYLGWIPKSTVIEKTPEQYLRWMNGIKAHFTVPVNISKIDFPACGEFIYDAKKGIQLPDGKFIKVPEKYIKIINPKKRPLVNDIIKSAKQFIGTVYLWGGKTDLGIDCSGFMQTIHNLNGLAIPRDASQQVNVGYAVGHFSDYSDLIPGDLIFFLNEKAKIYHVGMSLGGNKFIHSYGKGGVGISEFNTNKKPCEMDSSVQKYHTEYAIARRIIL